MEKIFTQKNGYCLVIIFLSLFGNKVCSQSGNCSGVPQNLSVNSSCTYESFSVNTDGTASEEVNASCATGTDYADGWYSVTGTGNNITISVDNSSRNLCLAAFSSCVGGQLACTMINSGTLGSITFASVLGNTYYIQVQRRSGNNNNNLDGDICATSLFPAPANESCITATNLPCGTLNLAGTTNGTSDVPHSTGCTLSNYGVWYTFIGDGNSTTISINANGTFDHEVAVASGVCGALVNINCEENAGGGGTETISFITTIGLQYYVYVAHRTSGSSTTGSFTISRTCTVPPCQSATNLACGTVNLAGTTVGTPDVPHSTGCSMSNYGAWYTFIGDGKVNTISVDAAGAFDHEIAVASGTCDALINVGCEENVGNGGIEVYSFTATIGTSYFVYIADNTTGSNSTGTFTISRTCIDSPCETASILACGTNNLAGTTVGSSNIPHLTGCNLSNYGKWYTFVGDGQLNTISTTGVGGFDQEMAILEGSCDALINIDCRNVNGGNGTETYSFVPVLGTNYYIYVADRTSGSSTTGNFTISRTCSLLPCYTATNLPCGTNNLAGTTIGTQSIDHNTGCSISKYGAWYTFVGDGQQTTISSLSPMNQEMAITSGTCDALINIACIDNSGQNITETFTMISTIGTTYFVYIGNRSTVSNTTDNFTISRTCAPPPAPPVNDECIGAINLTVNPTNVCTIVTAGTINGATQSVDLHDCGGVANNDVWYSFTATEVSHNIDITNVTGGTDLYHSVYSGVCGAIGASILCSDPNSSTLYNLTIGNVYYVRIYSENGLLSNSTFNVCINVPPPMGACGNELTNDWCDAPALLTKGAGNFSSSTYDYYLDDEPANLENEFNCGTIENNSYYQFIASATTEVFNFSTVANCENGDGIQAHVYEVTNNASGCCTNFESMSNCWSPGNDVPGIVTAVGLTIGAKYILMVDGWAGDHCDFTVSGWTATGILLPIELLSFSLENVSNTVELTFETASERDMDYFEIENSRDGNYWQSISKIQAHGNSTSVNTYKCVDKSPFNGLSYYRLKDVSINGVENYSDIISNEFSSSKYLIYPVPVNNIMFLEGDKLEQAEIYVVNNVGEKIEIEITPFGNKSSFNFENIKNGIYFVKIQTAKTKRTERIVVVHK